MLSLNFSHYTIFVKSKIQLLKYLRFNYAVISSGLILFGFFWNNLKGFNWEFITLITSFFFANVFGFVANDFYDAASDSEEYSKQKRNVFCFSNTSGLGKTVLYASLVLSIFLSGLISTSMLLLILLFDILALSYSAPPFKLRNRLYWDWISIFLWKGLIIFAGYFYFFGISFPHKPFMLETLTIVMLFSLISQINNQIRDFETDKKTNATNSVQRLGLHNALFIKHVLSVSFYISSFVFSCYLTLSLIL